MSLLHLGLRNIRNLTETGISPGPAVNLICGANGSGKTSLLESIYLLGHGKSFRTPRLNRVIQRGAAGFVVAGKARSTHALRIDYQPGELQIVIDRQPVKRTSELARQLPLVLINTDSHRLLEDGPRMRRRFLDWGAFHVEQTFLAIWKRYHRALRQRNAALRMSSDEHASAWNTELSQTAAEIHRQRRHYLEQLIPAFDRYTEELLGMAPVTVDYSPGWPAEQALEALLASGMDQDRQAGHTRAGPHRADFTVRVDGVPAQQCVSRGQQKLLICALHLAQADGFNRFASGGCIVLVDDLAAELDPAHRNRLLRLLAGTRQQVFVTATEPELFERAADIDIRLFHVERGCVRVVDAPADRGVPIK